MYSTIRTPTGTMESRGKSRGIYAPNIWYTSFILLNEKYIHSFSAGLCRTYPAAKSHAFLRASSPLFQTVPYCCLFFLSFCPKLSQSSRTVRLCWYHSYHSVGRILLALNATEIFWNLRKNNHHFDDSDDFCCMRESVLRYPTKRFYSQSMVTCCEKLDTNRQSNLSGFAMETTAKTRMRRRRRTLDPAVTARRQATRRPRRPSYKPMTSRHRPMTSCRLHFRFVSTTTTSATGRSASSSRHHDGNWGLKSEFFSSVVYLCNQHVGAVFVVRRWRYDDHPAWRRRRDVGGRCLRASPRVMLIDNDTTPSADSSRIHSRYQDAAHRSLLLLQLLLIATPLNYQSLSLSYAASHSEDIQCPQRPAGCPYMLFY